MKLLLFLKCLVEVSSEVVGLGILCGRALNYKLNVFTDTWLFGLSVST